MIRPGPVDLKSRAKPIRIVRAWLGLLGLAASMALPADDLPTDTDVWSITIKNDLFGRREDGHYSSGVIFGHTPATTPAWLARLGRRLPCVPCQNISRVVYTLGQSIYTPEDISVAELQTDDRPYAGWLHAGIGLLGQRATTRPNLRSYDAIELTAGIIGPASLAAKTQRLFHRITGSTQPRGWSNQLDNEPALLLTYTRYWQFVFPGGSANDVEYDLTPRLLGAIGNVYTHAGAGAIWRLGKNLRADAGPGGSSAGFPAAAYFEPHESLSWYAFLGTEARAVARNIFLDGNTFVNSHSVGKKDFVMDVQLGLTVSWKKMRLTFSEVFRSKEFAGQRGSDNYGSIALAFSL